ncbi:MAG: hypothetical protein R3F59_12540 [Myxococcota bacterium]
MEARALARGDERWEVCWDGALVEVWHRRGRRSRRERRALGDPASAWRLVLLALAQRRWEGFVEAPIDEDAGPDPRLRLAAAPPEARVQVFAELLGCRSVPSRDPALYAALHRTTFAAIPADLRPNAAWRGPLVEALSLHLDDPQALAPLLRSPPLWALERLSLRAWDPGVATALRDPGLPPTLRELELSVSPQPLALGELPALRGLRLEGLPVADALQAALPWAHQLQSLSIAGPTAPDADTTLLARFSALQRAWLPVPAAEAALRARGVDWVAWEADVPLDVTWDGVPLDLPFAHDDADEDEDVASGASGEWAAFEEDADDDWRWQFGAPPHPSWELELVDDRGPLDPDAFFAPVRPPEALGPEHRNDPEALDPRLAAQWFGLAPPPGSQA